MPPSVPPIQQQIKTKWCWAACTVYVCSIYGTNASITQKKFAARALGMPVCETNFPHPSCNSMFDFGEALDLVSHLEAPVIEGILTADELKDHFAASSNPIGCQVLFPDFGHAVVIADIRLESEGRLFVVVADPGSGTINTVPYEMFRTNYLGRHGRWIRTYLTKPH